MAEDGDLIRRKAAGGRRRRCWGQTGMQRGSGGAARGGVSIALNGGGGATFQKRHKDREGKPESDVKGCLYDIPGVGLADNSDRRLPRISGRREADEAGEGQGEANEFSSVRTSGGDGSPSSGGKSMNCVFRQAWAGDATAAERGRKRRLSGVIPIPGEGRASQKKE